MRYRGIDISEFQGNVNFTKVQQAGIECIIVRYGDPASSNYEDIYFQSNMRQCQEKGFHFGAYIFSRASSAKEARLEARNMIAACKKFKYDMPLYIDMEDSRRTKSANEVVLAFLDECDKAGVIGGVYANTNWFTNYINVEKIKDRPLWIADWRERIGHKTPAYFGAWQYTSSGKVPGINGDVDLDYFYVEYWKKKKPDPVDEYTDKEKQVAVDVIFGKYGNGSEREKALGGDYKKVQSLVNEIIERLG